MGVLSENMNEWKDWTVCAKLLAKALIKFKQSPINETHDVVASIIKHLCQPTQEWCEYDNVIILKKNSCHHRNTIVLFATPVINEYNVPYIETWRCWPRKQAVGWEYVNMHSITHFLPDSKGVKDEYDAYILPRKLIDVLKVEL